MTFLHFPAFESFLVLPNQSVELFLRIMAFTCCGRTRPGIAYGTGRARRTPKTFKLRSMPNTRQHWYFLLSHTVKLDILLCLVTFHRTKKCGFSGSGGCLLKLNVLTADPFSLSWIRNLTDIAVLTLVIKTLPFPNLSAYI